MDINSVHFHVKVRDNHKIELFSDDFGTILSPAFRAATVFVGIAVIISIICIISFILFFMCRYEEWQRSAV